jgi:hypothetical protein
MMRDAAIALGELDKVLAIQASDGNWNYDAYMHGMLNGMIMAKSCITGETPEFREAPKQWLADRPSPPPSEDDTRSATAVETKDGLEDRQDG